MIAVFTVNGLKFQALFSFCSQIKGWLSALEVKNPCLNSKQGRLWSDCFFSLIWVLAVCLCLFGRQLVFEILGHLPYQFLNSQAL